ncbi:molybdopterin converting factor subunit 1 [Guptibacillus algicola]|uniref:molybdopterin converting factor subunit 1 n=1 Tax=Guptibacillus algicola TaxID=225844 RepID=UPI001CD277DA|nr:molybdopterin converting factor subunit 1 [Alkalihalobacillus algicola]MCA0987791.1 molybdopterin converting factor subunit 1 [Alkalihalobacillus algicola]
MVKILFFADQREKVGKDELEFEGEGMTVQHVKEYLLREYPSLKLHQTMTAINEEYEEEENRTVKANDVIAFIPPVSGG